MKKLLLIILCIMNTGCSAIVYNNSRKELIIEKAFASGDEAAIKAVKLNGGVGIGIDVSNTEVITKHPFKQLGAALIDAGLMYGCYQGIESLRQSNDKDSRNIYVTIDGTGNIVNINTGDSAQDIIKIDQKPEEPEKTQ